MRTWVMACALVAASPSAWSQGEPGDKSHEGQLSVNLALGTGYRAIFPTGEEFCGAFDDSGARASNCVGRSPALFGLSVGYAVGRRLELFAELGVGVESDFGAIADPNSGPRPFFVAPGLRGYIAEIGPTQLFSGVQLVVDFADFSQASETDYLIRNINGVQFDVHRTFGIYLYFGEAVGFRRWLSFTIEGGVGIQARFP